MFVGRSAYTSSPRDQTISESTAGSVCLLSRLASAYDFGMQKTLLNDHLPGCRHFANLDYVQTSVSSEKTITICFSVASRAHWLR